MATTKKETKKTDARDALGSNEGSELTAIAVKSLTNLEEKVESIDWKLWEQGGKCEWERGKCKWERGGTVNGNMGKR